MKKSLFIRCLVILNVILMFLCGSLVIVIDPYFHFHAPLSFLSYPLVNERYQNDGIARHFEYDAIITGSSMTENCRPSVVDSLFGVNSIPTCNSGGSFKEINEQLKRSLSYNGEVKIVIRGLDLNMMSLDKDYIGSDIPDYLYDKNIWNDIKYLFNKDSIICSLEVLWRTMKGYESTSLDEFTNWMDDAEYGEDILRMQYTPADNMSVSKGVNPELLKIAEDNITENVLQIVLDNPEIEFYYFITPYSIFFFDNAYRNGKLETVLAIEEKAIELLIGYENLHLYSYLDSGLFIEELGSYRDILHYCEWFNTQILEDMSMGDKELTEDNYMEYLNNRNRYFNSFDFDSLFK